MITRPITLPIVDPGTDAHDNDGGDRQSHVTDHLQNPSSHVIWHFGMSTSPSLFEALEANHLDQAQPLAARMRPRRLNEYIGQQHILGEGKLLRRMIDAGRLGSVIFYGPPGTGKTTLAHLLAIETGSELRTLSAVSSGVKDVREILAWARDLVSTGEPTPLLFIDEIHRFSKSQQDALLPDVEAGIVSLIGATTSNPHFSVNSALLSRSQLFPARVAGRRRYCCVTDSRHR